MKGSFTFNLLCAAVCISIGCLQLLAGFPGAGVAFAAAARVVYLPGQEIPGSTPPNKPWPIFGSLLILSLASIVCDLFRSSAPIAAIRNFFGHPAFVAPLWLFLMWDLFRRWYGQKRASDV